MPRDKQFNREEVIEKAMLLFWKQGYHDTSVQDLVEHLGINRGSLYDTFGGKRRVFEAAFERYRLFAESRLREFLREHEEVKPTLRTLFRNIIDGDCADADRKGCLIANSTTEMLPDDAELREVIARHGDTMEKLFRDFLNRGAKAGRISKDKDVKSIAGVLFTFMQGLRVVGKTRPPKRKLLASVDQMLSLLD